jgi:Flp pilus assembly secretin CpaC
MRPSLSALRTALAAGCLLLAASTGRAQVATDSVTRIDLPAGRSYPITTQNDISRISVATPEVADAVVVGQRDLVINAKTNGETDIIVWVTNEPRRHYRVAVHSVADRKSVHLAVRIAEVRKDLSHEFGVNGLYRDGNVRAGAGIFGSDNVFDKQTGDITIPSPTRF